MREMIQFLFRSGGKELLIGADDYGIIGYEGLTASDYDVVTAPLINGRGERVNRKKILKRKISVEFELKYLDGKENAREFLIAFFAPDSSGVLVVKRKNVERCIMYDVEKFQTKDVNVHSRLRCLVEIVCANPFFAGIDDTGIQVTTLVGGWKWRFRLPFKLKQYGPLRKNIYNGGHVETPVELYILGPAVNPKIVNHRTGQYIRLQKELSTDDILYINTEYGRKTVEIRTGDKAEDGWDYLDLTSEFWWLLQGDNVVEYLSEGDEMESKGVEIHYRERFLGI